MSSLDPPYQPVQATTTATATGLLGDPTVNDPCYLTPGVSTESILNRQKAAANVTDAWDTMTSHDPPHQPLLRRTLGANAASPENLVPPHNRKQTPGGIILCLPAQRKTSAETINLQSVATTMPPKNLTSRSQHLDSLAVNPESKSVTFWTSCHRCRMWYEYLRVFINQKLMCHECELPFVAMEIPAPNADVLKSLSVSVTDQCPSKFAASSGSRSAPASSRRDAQVTTAIQLSHKVPKQRHEGATNVEKGDVSLHQNTTTCTGKIDATSVCTASTIGLEGGQTIKKRRFGSKRPLANSNGTSVGNEGVPSQRNLPRRRKELPRDDIRRMLIDKARTEILRYFSD